MAKSFSFDKMLTKPEPKTPEKVATKGKDKTTEPAPPVSTAKTEKPAKTPENVPNDEKRVKFTTALMPHHILALKQAALNSGMQPADILQEILTKHFKR